MRLLFVIPSLSLTGGVASHYAGLAPYWTVGISYSIYGKRKKIPAPLTLLPDIISYTFKIVFKKIDVVVVNPSLRKYQLFRNLYTYSLTIQEKSSHIHTRMGRFSVR